MRILVAADIFGVTGHLMEFATAFGGAGNRCRIVGPYPASVWFGDEALAYAAFIKNGGIELYTAKMLGHLADSVGEPLVCIGFSAGAAALWRALADPAAGVYAWLSACMAARSETPLPSNPAAPVCWSSRRRSRIFR